VPKDSHPYERQRKTEELTGWKTTQIQQARSPQVEQSKIRYTEQAAKNTEMLKKREREWWMKEDLSCFTVGCFF